MLKDIIESKNTTVYSLSKELNIPYSTLNDIVTGKTLIANISAEVLYKLSCGLGMSMESLYLGRLPETVIYLYNDGRTVYVKLREFCFQYTGPKNLVSFKRVNRFESGCVYVDTTFRKDNGQIYIEEDYIDIGDLCEEYGVPLSVLENVTIRIGKPGESKRNRLVDNAILVSDYMAIQESDVVSDSVLLEISNVVRMNSKMQLRLKDYAVLSTNMSKGMQKRAIEAVRRNVGLIEAELRKRAGHA